MAKTIHQKVAEAIFSQAQAAQSPLLGMLSGLDEQQLCHKLFSSYRGAGGAPKGLRLSDEGLQLMKAFFKCYDVTLAPGYRLKAPHLIYLDRVSKMPYWVSDKYCAMFDSELAMMLKLGEGRIQDLVESRFRLTSSDGTLNPDM